MNYDRVKQIFTEAIKLPPEDRGAYLDKQCGDDADLRAQVESLLQNHSSTVKDPSPDRIAGEYQRGDTVGPFTIRDCVGGGGMGTVYLAQQTSPVRRQVALKVIKPGFDTRNTLARFQAEQQALAMMDHPGIAKVLEAGATDTGRPWFAMEYIRGQDLNTYCDENKLDTRQRLELFIKICDAVQHAHQKGIMHRDLKPGNILVTRDEHDEHQPKVIDFGIAKAVSVDLTDMTLHTVIGQLVGTLAYMSPEQVRCSEDIDTRTDVYTLGVILYELLSGQVPFSGETRSESGHEAMKKSIREVDPPKPSTQFSSIDNEEAKAIALARRTDATSLQNTLRRELEWIPLKALKKDRTERYSSPEALATDIRRYLEGEPLVAVPPTKGYRIKKYLGRNKVPVFTAASFILVLVAATAVSIVLWLNADSARGRAEELQQEADAARDQAREQQSIAEQKTEEAREQEELAIAQWEEANLAKDQARMRLAEANEAKGNARRAAEFATAQQKITEEKTEEAKEQAQIANDQRLKAEAAEVMAIQRANEVEAAMSFVEKMFDLPIQTSQDDQQNINDIMGRMLVQAQFDAQRAFVERPLTEAKIRAAIGKLFTVLGRYEEAEKEWTKVQNICSRTLGEESVETLKAIVAKSDLFRIQREYSKAESNLRFALDKYQVVLGKDDPETLAVKEKLGLILAQLNEPHTLTRTNQYKKKRQEASSHLRYVLKIRRETLGDNHPDTIDCFYYLALLHPDIYQHDNQGDLVSKTDLYVSKAIEGSISKRGLGHPKTMEMVDRISESLIEKRKFQDAYSLLEPYSLLDDIDEQREQIFWSLQDDRLKLLINGKLGRCLTYQNNWSEAEDLLNNCLSVCRKNYGDYHFMTVDALLNICSLTSSRGEMDLARTYLNEATFNISRVGKKSFKQNKRLSELWKNICAFEFEQKNYDEAEEIGIKLLKRDLIVLYTYSISANEAFVIALYEAMHKDQPNNNYAKLADFYRRRIGNAIDFLGRYYTQEESKAIAFRKLLAIAIDAYKQSHVFHPDAGHDATAAEYRQMLAEIQGANTNTTAESATP